MFALPHATKSTAAPRVDIARKSAGVSAGIEALQGKIAAMAVVSADLAAAASDYTYDYSSWEADADETAAELNAARHILSEIVEHAPKVEALQREAAALSNQMEALFDLADAANDAASDVDDLLHERELLTTAVEQLTARLASF